GNLSIVFSEPVSGVDVNDFVLTRDGVLVSLSGLSVSGSGSSYALNLSTVTPLAGNYVLKLTAAGPEISAAAGNFLAIDVTDSWTTDTTVPTADIVDVAPDPRNTAVANVSIVFSEPVSGVDVSDFVLIRDGVPVSLSGVLISGSGFSYALNLSTVTATAGN